MLADFKDVSVAGVKFHEKGKAPAIVLQDNRTSLASGILVTRSSAHTMLAALDPTYKEKHTRPLSHDFVHAVATAAGVRFGRVVIDRLHADGWFGATVEICAADGRLLARVDARPSDALPVAVSGNVPIVVAADVAEKMVFSDAGQYPYRDITSDDLESG